MSRRDLLSQVSGIGRYDLWGDLNRLIRLNQLLPIVSNAVTNNYIFDVNDDGIIGVRNIDESNEIYHLLLEEQLAHKWADFIRYPLAETPLQIPRVAQYNQVISDTNDQAKLNYLTFLKLYLIQIALEDKQARQVAESYVEMLTDPITGSLKEFSKITDLLYEMSFAEIAYELGYPRYETETQDPLAGLASLPLSVYVTTSHYDFLERALAEKGKYPRVHVCTWFEERYEVEWYGGVSPNIAGVTIQTEPSASLPIVYHLYGLEKYPASLVLSEDDYLEFLVKVSEDKNNIPLGLRRALGKSSLLLLGYRLRGWDFRLLFRGVIKSSKLQQTNFAIQLNPNVHLNPHVHRVHYDRQVDLKEAQQFMEKYFEPSNFKIEWADTTHFVQKLLQQWKKSNQ